ncbi:MAG: TonB-dependent receptor, partial [Melioribacteraceae bacterium]
SLNYKNLRMEVFGTNVWNYVNQTQITINGKRNVTYKNVDAYMLGFNFDADWKHLNISANYTYAQNKTNASPLAEIPPFKITSTIYSPEFSGLTGFIRHTFNDSQTRVDLNLSEKSTPSWNKLDAGISYTLKTIRLSLEVENITNELYYQHLSYSRDPFASGATVFEPGRTIRFNIKYDNVF